MNVGVKHNGTTITGFVLSYERVHKICTGIGTLTIDIDRTIGRTFDPWDTIDIYENGSLQVRYYVSSILDQVPEGKLTLDCQDKSKRLVDYFIPDSYTVDYPSYSRYWIEKFLTEAGITYQFRTTSQGNLLSNYTQLGLCPAYEQILTLLQMSGWYMFFDGNGKAIIGVLDADMAVVSDNLDRFDILQISRVSDDKMLRNRALVWGAFDPIRNEFAYADVYRPTRWNYDRNDIRTMVVSNSNIPNRSSAYGIANLLLKEFTKITVEKHLTVWGAREITLGTAVRVRSTVWTGKGLVTTFSVNMSKDGLVTNLVLDERCPRLFGFFDFGDYVYVGTYGDGVWRKHIKFDHTWHNFSTGLTDLRITDLHINNEIFGAVAASGQMYYTPTNEGPWIPLGVASLESSLEDNITTSGELVLSSFSGIMARATIVDKISNHVKFGVDNYSGLNMGDYFMMQSGWLTAPSGMVSASGHRGWILEYDPFTGALVGGLGSGIYPISISGNYDIQVIDLENDGVNDYVSVKTGGGLLMPFNNVGYNHGKQLLGTSIANAITSTQNVGDSSNIVSMTSRGQFDDEGETLSESLVSGTTIGTLTTAVYDNEMTGEREVIWMQTVSGTRTIRRRKYSETFSVPLGRNVMTSTLLTSPALTGAAASLAIYKLSTDLYRIFINTSFSTGSGPSSTDTTLKVSYMDWDTSSNTVSSITDINSFTITFDTAKVGSVGLHRFSSSFSVQNGKITCIAADINDRGNPNGGGFYTSLTNYIKFYYVEVDMASLSFIGQNVYNVSFHNSGGNIGVGDWTLFKYGPTTAGEGRAVSAYGASYALVIGEANAAILPDATNITNWLISTENGINWQTTVIQTATSTADPAMVFPNQETVANQLTDTKYMMYWRSSTSGKAFVFNGDTLAIVSMPTIPFNYVSANIRMMTGTYDNYYLALNGSTWYFCNPHTFAAEIQMTFPSNYTIIKPFSTSDSYAPYYYWEAVNNTTSKIEILISTTSSVVSSIIPFSASSSSASRGYVVGNFFVHFDKPVSGTSRLGVLYVNNTSPINSTTKFLVLQRDVGNFNLIQESTYPIREEISNNSPVWTVGSGEFTFKSHYIYTGEQVVISPAPVITASGTVMDFRYTMLEPTSGVFGFDPTASGIGVGTIGLYVYGSGVYGDDISTYSGFVQMYSIPSGFANRIETTNYAANGQYIFVTISGEYPAFYQKDPESLEFINYSGLPLSRATIIRIDDFI